jgi:hypothetical protein
MENINNKQQTEMNKDFVPYELALELKQLGFDEPCFASIDQTDFIHIKGTEYPIRGAMIYDAINCPTYLQAFRWFRDKFNCHHTINLNKKYVGIAYSSVVNFSIDEFNTYEEAELECLKKLIEIVKTYGGGEQ